MTTPDRPVTRTPWLRRDQWTRFCEVFAGDDPLPPNYDAWLRDSQNSVIDMTSAGFKIQRVEINVEALVQWCKRQNRVVDPLSMMLFAAAVAPNDHDSAAQREARRSGKVPTFKQQTFSLGGPGGPKVTFHIPEEIH